MTSPTSKLESEIQEVEWSALRQHLARDGLVTVSPELDLLTVAEAVAADDKVKVAQWIEKGSISKPTERELALWETQLDRRFRFIIVSPFVLIQHSAH